ncbi:hypothetical protein DYBT9275_01611 [Dyadobacter sp. CECT 9275]|uniref:SGNH/GDSL hydrolase family protein n=1 Tax=Dyadobacter helix TaxID=2822344 RepID=A0A916JAK9_9BACT|nr:SGNH/GDSL hydrolase family protein [Dyadobacter sp. CECT 9275]CAG4995332.1 hypothetical protein DYBT9275_01611 [Dyadobacter sp. CECT 9275]
MRKRTSEYAMGILMQAIMFCSALLCQACSSGKQEPIIPEETVKINKVLILGNSITFHGSKPDIGWTGNYGMAASSESHDYVHLLEGKIKTHNASAQFSIGNIAATFERVFWQADTSHFTTYRDFKPDLIILRIGENITDSLAVEKSLDKHVESLISYLKQNSSPRVCLVGSFWPNANINRIFEELCVKNKWDYVSLDGLYQNRQVNTAINNFANAGVGMHPSDQGMKEISERIWAKIQYLFLI